ncbi:hypothetical protein [Aeromicrobium piscarium]|uniref:Uncharacterized protein n=1 Tax=Aeromicrobium piscarium TaxID=2590901 RepID=A0A554S887_9ACTN|nr:hypothetical protein [Aeromicrobium piscarium]TSD62532.1 hypothetical protein FNM00_11280 [Aeromicrobium piscarium]
MSDWWIHLLGVGGLSLLVPTTVLLASLRWGWTAFAEDYPADVRARLPEPSRGEVRAGWVLGPLFLVTLLAALLVTTATWPPASERFASAWLMAFGVTALFCLIDMVVVDWLVICAWRPSWVVVRGTEDAEGWGDYAFHLRAQLSVKGLAVLIVLPLLFATIVYLLP